MSVRQVPQMWCWNSKSNNQKKDEAKTLVLLVFGCLLGALCREDLLSSAAVPSWGLVSYTSVNSLHGCAEASGVHGRTEWSHPATFSEEVWCARASFCSTRVGTGHQQESASLPLDGGRTEAMLTHAGGNCDAPFKESDRVGDRVSKSIGPASAPRA